MAKIVLGETAKIDVRTTLETVRQIASASAIESDVGDVVYLLESTVENLAAVNKKEHTVYVPATLLTESFGAIANVHIYFDLDNYPFYQTAKGIIEKRADDAKLKGVFRYRRMVLAADAYQTLAADLFVIYSLFGEPVDIQVTRTDQTVNPAHTIVLLNFGEGTLAHVEYTITDRARIELEWSGIKSIIEFNSDELNPFEPSDKTKLPLMYSVDSILKTAKIFDIEIINLLVKIRHSLNGGGQQ